MSKIKHCGRLCNQIIKNLSGSFLAKTHDLYMEYHDEQNANEFGIELYCGKNKFDNTISVNESNYYDILNGDKLKSNVDLSGAYMQTKHISNLIYNYLREPEVKNRVINKNKFRDRYTNNNDCYIHIRLDDAIQHNPGLKYYIKTLQKINCNKIYISTDQPQHFIIQQLLQLYFNSELVSYNPIDTIKFASTNRYIILSHGSYSAMIGFLGYYSHVFYPEYLKDMWCGDLFSIDGWNKVEFIE